MTAKTAGRLAALMATAIFLVLAPVRRVAAEEALSRPQLEQLAAPIALSPDELIAQVLDASQYPQDVSAASRWRSTVGAALTPGEAAAALRDEPWAPSVKALVDVPDVLYAMSRDLGWTEALGRAHATRNAQLLAAIQDLRRRAEAAGNLHSGPQQVVEDDGRSIVIDPAMADSFYLPCYDPDLVYGTWPWAGSPPDFFGDCGDWSPDIAFMTVYYVGPHWHHRAMHWHGQARDRDDHRVFVPAGVGRIAATAPAPPSLPAAATTAAPPMHTVSPPGGFDRRFHGFGEAHAFRAPPPPRFSAPQVITVPPVRMMAPTGGFAREFNDSGARAFTAPAARGSFGGWEGGGHSRR
jgi:hypothetical protein